MDTGESALHFWDPEFCDFKNRAPIGAFARAPARSKLGEILNKCSKIMKNTLENKGTINKCNYLKEGAYSTCALPEFVFCK